MKYLEFLFSRNCKLSNNDVEIMEKNIDRTVIKLNDCKINGLTEKKRDIVLRTDLLLEETKKSAKNIGYLIKGFWPDKQKIYDIGEAIDNTSKSDIKNLRDAYEELEDLKKKIRDVQIHLEGEINESQPESRSDDVRKNMKSLAKNLTLKTNIMMEQLEKFKLPDKIYMNN